MRRQSAADVVSSEQPSGGKLAGRPAGTVAASVAGALLETLVNLGATRSTLIVESGLDVDSLDNPEQRIDVRVLDRLAQAAGEELGHEDDIGIRVAQCYEPGFLDVYDYVLFACATLGDVFSTARQYVSLVYDGMDVVQTETGHHLAIRYARDGEEWPPHSIECAYSSTVVVLRHLSGNPELSPQVVRFPHVRPADVSAHERLFRCRLEFSCVEHGMVWTKAQAKLSLDNVDHSIGSVTKRYADLLLDRLPGATFSQRVCRALAPKLAAGGPYVKEVATVMGMSERSFRRRLAEEGVGFAELLDGLRLQLARDYLVRGNVSVAETARLLGYSERAAFSRAFRRWTGTSPAHFAKVASESRASRSGTRRKIVSNDD